MHGKLSKVSKSISEYFNSSSVFLLLNLDWIEVKVGKLWLLKTAYSEYVILAKLGFELSTKLLESTV